MKAIAAGWALFVLLSLGCGPAAPAPAGEEGAAATPLATFNPAEVDLPGTYTGTVPCADCAGIRLTVKLRGDGLFQLRRAYLGVGDDGGDRSFAELGVWSLDAASGRVLLRGGPRVPRALGVAADGGLLVLHRSGEVIDSELGYSLAPADDDPFPDILVLRGLYSYLADAARFEECLTGRGFPVAAEGDAVALERAYLAARQEPGEPLLAAIEGRLTMRPPMETGQPDQETVVVDRFLEIFDVSTCSPH